MSFQQENWASRAPLPLPGSPSLGTLQPRQTVTSTSHTHMGALKLMSLLDKGRSVVPPQDSPSEPRPGRAVQRSDALLSPSRGSPGAQPARGGSRGWAHTGGELPSEPPGLLWANMYPDSSEFPLGVTSWR